jgi:hypothetical protein
VTVPIRPAVPVVPGRTTRLTLAGDIIDLRDVMIQHDTSNADPCAACGQCELPRSWRYVQSWRMVLCTNVGTCIRTFERTFERELQGTLFVG